MRKVLLVDDDDDFRLIIRDLVEDCSELGDLAIMEAASSEEAERLCDLQSYDLYIVDYLMDVDSGGSSIGFLVKLYGEEEEPAVILCTGFPFEGLAPAYQELLSTGTMRLLPKESLSRASVHRLLQQLLGPSMSVLLVDDDEEDIDYVSGALRSITGQYFTMKAAHSLEDGLAALRGQDFDLHLIDYRLGHEIANELVERVIARTSRPPIVMSQYSADDLDLGMVERVAHGEVIYVPKAAIDTRRLVAAIQRVSYQSAGAEALDA